MDPFARVDRPSSLDATISGDGHAPTASERTTVGRYSLVRIIGAGGGGTVYEAVDPDLERRVAVKVIEVDELRGRKAERLVREAKALAQLSHPNIVTVLDVGHDSDAVFITMELVDGQSLDDWIARDVRPSWSEVLRVYRDAARGLQAAHDAGLVHRDFKPSNAMTDRSGRVLVMDFGLALPQHQLESKDRTDSESEASISAEHSDPRLSRTGEFVGTPLFMAPEQYSGLEVTPATDQFAWCLALYEALYGQPAFDASGVVSRAAALLAGELREPTSTRGVPGRIWPVLRRGLAQAPSERWPSMRDASEALADASRVRRRWLAAPLGLGLLAVAAAFPGTADSRLPSPEPLAQIGHHPMVAAPLRGRLVRLREQVEPALAPGANPTSALAQIDGLVSPASRRSEPR
jgi:serine/threonine protein kinase